EKVLKDTIGEFEQDALDTSGNELEYSILQRNLNTSKHLYDTLLLKIKESDLLKTSDSSHIRLVEEAITPVSPISPNKKKNIMMGIIMGLAGGVMLALFLEYLDQTIRTEEDVHKHLGIPILSVVPIAEESEKEKSKT
ncbi:MAG: aldo/keto reductase, partial [Bacteroidetes bacterium]|nr:aldo/keto reductase [Bacteroidota bacterium]